MDTDMTDEQYMRMALQLAENGCGAVNPNPMVGAVIVKDKQIIGRGFHEKYGGLHAERNALADCSVSPEGATLYVTLEPCCHYGKTPPCTEAIIENRIAKVVIGSKDPNALVSGKGIEILRRHGIEVVEHVLEDECNKLNQVFFHYIREKTPYVIMKYAMTMDGKIAAYTGRSKWITGKEARLHVHQSRNRYSGIMTGAGTVIADDPMLTCRIENGRNPVRIICDTSLRTPVYSQVVKTAGEIPTYIATSCTDKKKHQLYIDSHCNIITVPRLGEHIDLKELMKKLGEKHIDSILLEGGSSLNWSALQSGIVHKVQVYISPKLLGGEKAKTPIGGIGAAEPAASFRLTDSTITRLGEDFLIESEVTSGCSQE